jgi:putative ABC transport system permease protein
MASVVCVAGIGLALGCVGAVFSVADIVFVKALPFPTERLVVIEGARFRMEGGAPRLPQWIGENPSLTHAGFCAEGELSGASGGRAQRLHAAQVSGDFFQTMAVAPLAGRYLTNTDIGPARLPVAVIGDRLWRQWGRPVDLRHMTPTIGGQPFTVVGVMPPGFEFPQGTDVWVPASFSDTLFTGAIAFKFIGRLAPDWSRSTAQAQLEAAREREGRLAGASAAARISLIPLRQYVFRDFSGIVLCLQLGALMVLAIAGLNAAHLQAAEEARRALSTAIQGALGTPRSAFLLELSARSIALGVSAGTLGIGVARLVMSAITSRMASESQWFGEIHIGARVGAAIFLLSVLCMMAVSLAARRSQRGQSLAALLQGNGFAGSSSLKLRGLSRLLSTGQLLLATGLSTAMALFLGGFVKMLSVQPGFNAANSLTATVSLAEPLYKTTSQRVAWFNRIADRIREHPQVRAVSMTNSIPLSGSFDMAVAVRNAGSTKREDDPSTPSARYRVVAPGYFETMGIPLLAGRTFSERDVSYKRPICIVNRRLSSALWSTSGKVGQQVVLGDGSDGPMEVVGVTGDVRHVGLDREPDAEIYLLYGVGDAPATMSFVVSTNGKPESMTRWVAGLIREQDPGTPVYSVRTFEEVIARSFARRAVALLLLGGFALSAVALAAMGVFAAFRHAVILRRRDFAIRMSLGATPGDIRGLVFHEALRLGVIGIAGGILLGFGIARVMGALVPSLGQGEIAMALPVWALLCAALGAAVLPPAIQAARVDPASMLRA